jgi:hypothetical protein
MAEEKKETFSEKADQEGEKCSRTIMFFVKEIMFLPNYFS